MATRKKSSKPKKSTAERAMDALAPIVEALERGDSLVWRQPWNPSLGQVGSTDNLYRGINQFSTSLAATERGYKSRRWWTFDRIMQEGGAERKTIKFPNGGKKVVWSGGDYSVAGTKGKWITIVHVEWKAITEEDAESGEESVKFYKPYIRFHSVLNLDEVTGMPDEVKYPDHLHPEPGDVEPVAAYWDMIGGWQDAPKVNRRGDRAFYSPKADSITLPKTEQFVSGEAEAKVHAHESVHATGHKSRLNRPGVANVTKFGDEQYAYEELVAESGAAALCGAVGITSAEEAENSAAYCQSWLKALNDDPVKFMQALNQGTAAAFYILGIDSPAEKDAAKKEEVAA